ncbi:MAG: YggS family pyridoxal phosphate-dependent enzyme [Phycisphaeraceae bacterium]
METEPIVGPSDLRDAYARVHERIADAASRAGRRPRDVVLVAVTKTATPDQIRALVEMGQVDLAENRVQQLTQRVAQLDEYLSRRRALGGAVERETAAVPDRVRWHMIGHLQRNKVKQVVPVVELIHGVDSLRLAEELHNYAAKTDRVVDILVQVNASGEVGKHGISPPAVGHLIEQIDTMVHVRARGLMTMAPYTGRAEDSRGCFARTAEIFEEVCTEGLGGSDFNILSMGMSDDFEVAIEEGANVVRVGRALFGEER